MHACRLNNGLALASQKVQTPDNLEMDEMDEEEGRSWLRKQVVDSKFPAPPPLEFSRRCNGRCRKDRTVPIMPGDPGRGRMHIFPRLPPRRIAGCLEGPELEAARAEWHAMDKTDEREAMRRARNLAMSRSAPHREGDSARRAKARREKRDRERELLAITFKISPHAAYHPPARPGVYLGLSATHRGRYNPLSRAARGAHPISPPAGGA